MAIFQCRHFSRWLHAPLAPQRTRAQQDFERSAPINMTRAYSDQIFSNGQVQSCQFMDLILMKMQTLVSVRVSDQVYTPIKKNSTKFPKYKLFWNKYIASAVNWALKTETDNNANTDPANIHLHQINNCSKFVGLILGAHCSCNTHTVVVHAQNYRPVYR